MSGEPDLSKTLGMDIDILDGAAINALVQCYDREIQNHVYAYMMASCNHKHFMERVTYYQLRKRNLLELWSDAVENRRASEPF